MSSYVVIIHKDEDSSYGAHVPDLPGCYAAGESLEQTLDSANKSVGLYLSDFTGAGVPRARSLTELSSDAEVRQEIAHAHGVFVLES